MLSVQAHGLYLLALAENKKAKKEKKIILPIETVCRRARWFSLRFGIRVVCVFVWVRCAYTLFPFATLFIFFVVDI